jgi:CheY-like chemotaxis protein
MPEHADGSDEVFDIEIAVQDTGVGIHDEHLESIFESFTQGRASIKRVYGGTGLGLTISRKIARDLGGDLTVQSTRGVGSLFVCRFQVSRTDSLQTDQDTDKSTQATPIEHLCNHRFLLVEDGNDNQRLIQHNFNKQGLRIDTASDGYQGIEAIQSATERGADYSLILMDISMPNMDGIECTRKLRSDGITTPIVMLTAHTLQTEVDRSFAAGATAYVNKPIDFKALFDLCAEILNEDQKPTSFAA